MPPDRDPPPTAACVLVRADGWTCVQRVVVLLTARGYAVDSLAATSTATRSWEVRIVLRCRPAELLLLQARLERLPSVTSVLTAGTAGGDPVDGPAQASS